LYLLTTWISVHHHDTRGPSSISIHMLSPSQRSWEDSLASWMSPLSLQHKLRGVVMVILMWSLLTLASLLDCLLLLTLWSRLYPQRRWSSLVRSWSSNLKIDTMIPQYSSDSLSGL